VSAAAEAPAAAPEPGEAGEGGGAAAKRLLRRQRRYSRVLGIDVPGEGNPSGWVDGNHPSSTTPVGLDVANPATP